MTVNHPRGFAMNLTAWSLTLSRRWGRSLVLLAAFCLAFSTGLLVLATLAPGGWLSVADPAAAALLIVLGLLLVALAGGNIPSRVRQYAFEVYRAAAVLPFGLLAILLVFGARLNWTQLLIGLAWRTGLWALVLPSALTIWDLAASRHRAVFLEK